MKKLRFLVSLTTKENDYQLEQAASAQEASRRLGVDLEILYADNDAITQSTQILKALQGDPQLRPDAIAFEPVGATDTELIFCTLLGRIAARGWPSLAEADLGVLHGWLLELNARGSLDMVLCDGRDLLAYADRFGAQLGVLRQDRRRLRVMRVRPFRGVVHHPRKSLDRIRIRLHELRRREPRSLEVLRRDRRHRI